MVAMAEFAGLSDEAFLLAAYRRLLGRDPDPAGRHAFLKRLHNGVTQTEILGDIRFSPEGRRAAIRVPGLRLRHVLARARRWLRSGKQGGTVPAGARPQSMPSDAAFLARAYLRFLGRGPDPQGRDAYLAMLRAGRTREEILAMIRASPEAVAHRSGARTVMRADPVLEEARDTERELAVRVARWTAGGRRRA